MDFHPSYKKKVPRAKSDYTTGEKWVTDCYDINFKQQWYKGGKVKLRMPSWTDRVLYTSLPAHAGESASKLEPASNEDLLMIGQPLYAAENDVLLCSDHSPVHACFSMTALNQRLETPAQRRFRYRVEIVDVAIEHPAVAATAAPTPEPAAEPEGGEAPEIVSKFVDAQQAAGSAGCDAMEEIPAMVKVLVPSPWEGSPAKPECKLAPPTPAQPDLLSMGTDGAAAPAPAAAEGGAPPDLLSMAPEPAPAPAPSDLLAAVGFTEGSSAAAAAAAGTNADGLAPDDARNNIYRFVGGDLAPTTEHHMCLKVVRPCVNPDGTPGTEEAEVALPLTFGDAPPPPDPAQVDLLSGGGGAAAPAPEPLRCVPSHACVQLRRDGLTPRVLGAGVRCVRC